MNLPNALSRLFSAPLFFWRLWSGYREAVPVPRYVWSHRATDKRF